MYLYYQEGYDLNYILESRMDTLSASSEAKVVAVLTRLNNLESTMDDSVEDGVDGLKSLDQGSVVFQDASEQSPLEGQNARGRALVTRLESLLQVQRAGEYFSEGSSSGGPICLG